MLVSVTALLLFSAPTVALAAGTAQSPGRYCVARAIPAGSSARPVATCYATFAQSIRAATRGRVNLPATAAPGSISPDQLNKGPMTPDTTFVLAIDYKNSNFGPPTLTWTQSAGCGRFQASSMPSGWNDVISSVALFSGCASTLFQNNGFGGTTFHIGKNGSAASLGTFNDKTSSQKWCPTSPC